MYSVCIRSQKQLLHSKYCAWYIYKILALWWRRLTRIRSRFAFGDSDSTQKDWNVRACLEFYYLSHLSVKLILAPDHHQAWPWWLKLHLIKGPMKALVVSPMLSVVIGRPVMWPEEKTDRQNGGRYYTSNQHIYLTYMNDRKCTHR